MMRRKNEIYLNERKIIFNIISQNSLEVRRLEAIMLLANIATGKSK